MKILCVFGRHNYGDPDRGSSYEYTNFLPAFSRLGHAVHFFESWDRRAYSDFAELNQRLLRTVAEVQPDLIFCVLLGYEVWTETLQLVRDVSDALLVNWATDDSWKYDQFSRFLVPFFDLYVTTYVQAVEKASASGHRQVVLSQWAANAAHLQEPIPARSCRWDVSFIGTAYGNRMRWISDLRSRGIRVNCHGYGWDSGPVAAEAIPEIIRHSVISLNFGDSNWMLKGSVPYRSRQIKARVFEVPGSGGLLMTETADQLEDFYLPGKEIVTFADAADLADKINFILANPTKRDEIARAGYRRTRRQHTYDQRFEKILSAAAELRKGPSRQPAAPPLPADWSNAFHRLTARHRTNARLHAVKKALLIPCNLIWGRQRGPRAARRLLFELSWRLCGEKTYAASGWPGRLFYHES